MNWTPAQLPDLAGKTYAITGGNSGLGLQAAKILTSKGARVIITSRSEAKAEAALSSIRAHSPGADVDFVSLDLADADSIAACAKALEDACPELDAIINNAGVMQPPLTRTAEGFELQMATNHLGHFRLNAKLLPRLERQSGRIAVVASIAHKYGAIDFDDLMSEKSYDATRRYAQSKLANLMYAFELQRRLKARGSSVACIACHPGYSATNLQTAGVGMQGGSTLLRLMYKVTNVVIAQSAEHGAYPLVLAAADPTAQAGAYYGPTGLGQMRGSVGLSFVADNAKDEDVARRLWEVTEDLVGPFFAD